MGTLRTLLALCVVLDHLGWSGVLAPSWVAVQTFFMISGFLMAMVLERKYLSRPDGLRLFWGNRVLRLYPLYLLTCAAILAANLALFAWGRITFGLPPQLWSNWRLFAPVELAGIVAANLAMIGQDLAFLAPPANPPLYSYAMLTQGWSLAVEVEFYLLAPLLVRLRSPWLALLLAAGLALRQWGEQAGLPVYRLLPFQLCFFLAGMLGWRLAARLDGMRTNAGWLAAGLVLFFWPLHLPEAVHYGLTALLLPVLFRCTERCGPDAAIGELSYPLYLVHGAVITAGVALNGDHLSQPQRGACLAASLLLAVALARWVEIPLERLRQRRVLALSPCPGAPARV